MPLSQPRDPEATRRQLAPWLARRMPQARDLAITSMAPPAATGFSNDTLLFDLEWTEDGRARRAGMVVRIEPRGFTVFPAYDVGQQFHIMQRLGEATDVPVPPMFWLEDRTDVLGARFFVMGRVEGRVPPDNPPYTMDGWLKEASPEIQEKYKRGPVGFMTILPSGPPVLPKFLVQWFVFCLLVGVFVAYLAAHTVASGVAYLGVFRVVGTAAFLAYGMGSFINGIWKGQRWGAVIKDVIDGLVYGLLTAGTFGWLWPR